MKSRKFGKCIQTKTSFTVLCSYLSSKLLHFESNSDKPWKACLSSSACTLGIIDPPPPKVDYKYEKHSYGNPDLEVKRVPAVNCINKHFRSDIFFPMVRYWWYIETQITFSGICTLSLEHNRTRRHACFIKIFVDSFIICNLLCPVSMLCSIFLKNWLAKLKPHTRMCNLKLNGALPSQLWYFLRLRDCLEIL
jgi:hypothetical protein